MDAELHTNNQSKNQTVLMLYIYSFNFNASQIIIKVITPQNL